MQIAKVVGRVVAARKNEKLKGIKLMVLEAIETKEHIIAADELGVNVGDLALVTRGSAARHSMKAYVDAPVGEMPIDAAIVGVIENEGKG